MKILKILIIDDDEYIHNTIEEFIKDKFPESLIDHAYHTIRAIKCLNNNQYDLVTLDGRLGEGHGREILSMMRDEQRKKVIIYSSDMSFLLECARNGILSFLKYRNTESLFTEMEKIIGEPF